MNKAPNTDNPGINVKNGRLNATNDSGNITIQFAKGPNLYELSPRKMGFYSNCSYYDYRLMEDLVVIVVRSTPAIDYSQPPPAKANCVDHQLAIMDLCTGSTDILPLPLPPSESLTIQAASGRKILLKNGSNDLYEVEITEQASTHCK